MHSNSKTLPARPRFTAHASKRAQQRGIKMQRSELVFMFGDIEAPAGKGCMTVCLSSRQIDALVEQGYCSAQESDRLGRLTLVTDGLNILTQYRVH